MAVTGPTRRGYLQSPAALSRIAGRTTHPDPVPGPGQQLLGQPRPETPAGPGMPNGPLATANWRLTDSVRRSQFLLTRTKSRD